MTARAGGVVQEEAGVGWSVGRHGKIESMARRNVEVLENPGLKKRDLGSRMRAGV